MLRPLNSTLVVVDKLIAFISAALIVSVAATERSHAQLLEWTASAGGRRPPAAAAAGATTTGGGGGTELASTSAGDLISDDWWQRFSEYRLEDHYAVQAKLDNEAGRPFPALPANTPPDADLYGVQQPLYGEPAFLHVRMYTRNKRLIQLGRG